MSNLIFGSDLSDDSEKVEEVPSSYIATKKRPADEISKDIKKSPSPQPEESQQLKKVKETKKEENIIVEDKVPVILKKPMITIEKPTQNEKEEAKSSQLEKPIMWINKLRCYPVDSYKEHMISFRELLFENLLRNSKYILD